MSSAVSQHLTILSYLKIFFRRKEILIIASFLGLTVGICLGIILPRQYISSTILLVEEGKTDNPLFDNLAVSSTVSQRLLTIQESILGWNSLLEVVKRLNLDRQVRTPKQLEDLILDIRKNITIKLRGNNIIDLSYYGDDPLKTQAVVKTLTEIFIERNLKSQNQETSDAIAFIEEQLHVYRGKIMSAEIAKLKDSLNTLLVDSTEAHPQVRKLREQITNKETELKKGNLEYTENINLASDTTNPIIQEIRRALDNLEGPSGSTPAVALPKSGNDIYKVMLIDKLDTVMARDVDVNDKIYNMLLQRLETAKITQRLQSSKEGTRYTILDPPRLPLTAVKPHRFLLAFLGTFIGILIGFGMIVACEFLDKSFIDVEDAKEFLGIPLLGAISKIHTEENLRIQKEKLAWNYCLVAIGGGMAIVLTQVIANLIR